MNRRAIVVGLGSIGQRHARLLKEFGLTIATVSLRPDVGEFSSVADAVRSYPDALLVIASETARHMSDLRAARLAGHRGWAVVEKPLAINCDDLQYPAPTDDVYVAYNLRFSPPVMALRAALANRNETALAVRMHVGQHLDSWRPGSDTAAGYSAHAARGGGVLRDLSHELDLSNWLWGRTTGVCALGGRRAAVTADSDDCWTILMKTVAGTDVALSLNYLDRPATRYIHVNTARSTYQADLVRGTLAIDGEIRHVPGDRDASYRAMWSSILASMDEDVPAAACSFSEGAEIVTLIADCENSARGQLWVKR